MVLQSTALSMTNAAAECQLNFGIGVWSEYSAAIQIFVSSSSDTDDVPPTKNRFRNAGAGRID